MSVARNSPGQAFTLVDQGFLAVPNQAAKTNHASGFSPAQIPGLAYYWNFNDLAMEAAVNSWTDRVSGVVLSRPANLTAPTNTPIGVRFDSDAFRVLTNSTILMSSNFSLWLVCRPTFSVSGDAVLFGPWLGPGGLVLKNGIVDGAWDVDHLSGNVLALNRVTDIVDSQGTLYENGAINGAGIGQPVNNYPFESVGNCAGIFPFYGYIQYIGVWTNYVLSATDVANLDNWVNTNGVTNVTTGLTAWWKFDEGSGTNTADSSGNGYAGTLANNPAWVDGVIGKAILFNGTNQYVDTTNIFDNPSAFTVTGWLKGAAPSGQKAVVSKISNGGINTGIGWTVMVEGVSDLRGLYQDPVNWVETPGFFIDDGNWHHFVICKDAAGNLIQYADGALIPGADAGTGVGTVGSLANSSNVRIADDYDGDAFGGAVDDVRIYNRVLSYQEAATLFRWRGQP